MTTIAQSSEARSTDATLVLPPLEGDASAKVPLGQRVRRALWRCILRSFLHSYHVCIAIAGFIGRKPNVVSADTPVDVLLTGTFYSDNWLNAHVAPLAASPKCRKLLLVTTFDAAPSPDVEIIAPPTWLRKTIGGVPSRLLTFMWIALRRRPAWVGGFHLLLNGLIAQFVARLSGSRALYFCVGGPMEVLGGGIWAENRLFCRLETPDPKIEASLLKAVRRFDLIITMGTSAAQFYRDHKVQSRCEVVSGAVNAERFKCANDSRDIDFILVARLSPIKRIDHFLRAVAIVAKDHPNTKAAIVGDGELREALESLAAELRITDRVEFLGHQSDVGTFLNRSKVFVLTSDSEGLALSLMEAMTCGLPAVVSNVGDLGDLVRHGENGFLIDERTPEQFAAKMGQLVEDDSRWSEFSENARKSSAKYETPVVVTRWNEILRSMS
ncbi:MAG: hypothetical protein DHS20C16_09910 [Phycisphaerae bacterium]|nr:MAG: hypothetical protein DHS20C16_09910 [Phycisphaerae bacterium]